MPPTHRLPPRLLGSIVLARYLEKSPASHEKAVARIDENCGSMPESLAGILVAGSAPSWPARVAGRIVVDGSNVSIVYRSEAFARWYPAALRARAGPGALHVQMRLVNTRNRWTDALVSSILAAQRPFLLSLDPADLTPLPQRKLVLDLARAGLAGLDASRASRLLGSFSLILPDGGELAARGLVPTRHDTLAAHLLRALGEERRELASGRVLRPLSDAGLARSIRENSDLSFGAAAVARARRGLGVPPAPQRARQDSYFKATRHFGSILRLGRDTILGHVPERGGVYELRLAHLATHYPQGSSPVLYVGGSSLLKKRLLDYLSPAASQRNSRLAERLKTAEVHFRFATSPASWRAEEAEVLDAFVSTYGTLPECNRAKPRVLEVIT